MFSSLTWRAPVLVAGLALVATETYGSWSYLLNREGSVSYLVVAGAACTVLSGFLPYVGERAWRDGQRLAGAFSFILLPLAVSTIVLAAIERSGAATDHANAAIANQARKLGLADDAVADARSAVAKASAAAEAECATGRGPHCESLEKRESKAQARLDDARLHATMTGPAKTNPLVSRLVAMLPLSDEQVTLYEPLLLPLTLSALSILLTAIGLGRPKQKIVAIEKPKSTALATVELRKADRRDVAKFMLDRMPRQNGSEVEIGLVFSAFVKWCSDQSPAIAPLEPYEFAGAFKSWCDHGSIRITRRRSGGTFIKDVALAG